MANTYATVYKTAAAWTAANPTLKGDATAGQEGVESDTGKRKMGPGAWNSLSYLPGQGTGLVYAPGGTDVAIADGGTGASSAATGLSNLGGAPLASPTFTGTVTLPTGLTGTIRADAGVTSTAFLAQLTSTQTTSNTTTDTTQWTPSNVAAAALVSGQTNFRARLGGNFDNKATSGTFTGRLKVNGTTVASIPVAISQTSLQTGTTWWVDMDVYIDTTGAGGVVSVVGGAIQVTNAAAGQNPRPVDTIATSVNLTAGCQFTWTVQMGTADVANIFRTHRGIIQQVA